MRKESIRNDSKIRKQLSRVEKKKAFSEFGIENLISGSDEKFRDSFIL